MLKQLLSLFLESRCVFCDRIASSQDKKAISRICCIYCQEKLLGTKFQSTNRLVTSSNLPIFAWGKYDGQLKRAIALMKYSNKPEIGMLLGKLLANAWLEIKVVKTYQKVTVVPIPLHRQKLQARGFNQAQVIAESFCQEIGYELNPHVLIRAKNTNAMYELTPQERVENLQNAFKLDSKLPRHPVLLLDDIYTTGSTIKESINTLRQQQIQVVGALVLASVL